MPKPTVLIIAYAFPPHSVVGSQRPLRMVKYLTRLTDWQPIVLSARQEFNRTDPSLLDEVPAGVPIYRARSLEPLRWLEKRRRGGGRRSGAGKPPADPSKRRSPAERAPAGGLAALKRFIVDLLSTPDPQLGWLPAAVWTGLRIARRHQPDVILVTAPPWSALIIGRVLGTLTGIPWIADYRDPWTDIDHGPLAPWRRKFERRLEGSILSRARLVLSSSDRYTSIMRERFRLRPPSDFATMFNGFDEEKFSGPTPPRDELFTITHLGSLYGYVQPEPVFVGLRDWLDRDPQRRPRVRLQFIGKIDTAIVESLARLGLDDLVIEPGFVPHAEAIRLCRRSSVLLLAMGITAMTPQGWMPSKLYEYLACRTPILAYTVPGEAAESIETAAAGVVVCSDDPTEVATALERIYRQQPAAPPADPAIWPESISRFTQAEIIPALATNLEQARRRRPR